LPAVLEEALAVAAAVATAAAEHVGALAVVAEVEAETLGVALKKIIQCHDEGEAFLSLQEQAFALWLSEACKLHQGV
jgi:hypothetical protein